MSNTLLPSWANLPQAGPPPSTSNPTNVALDSDVVMTDSAPDDSTDLTDVSDISMSVSDGESDAGSATSEASVRGSVGLTYKKQNATQLSFLDLPKELRDMIYVYYFKAPDGISIHFVSTGDLNPPRRCDTCAGHGVPCNGQQPCNDCDQTDERRKTCSYPPRSRSRPLRLMERGEWPYPEEPRFARSAFQVSTDTHRPVFVPNKRKAPILPFSHVSHVATTRVHGPNNLATEDLSTRRYFAENTKNDARFRLLQSCKAIYLECREYPMELNTFNIVRARMPECDLRDGSYHNSVRRVFDQAPRLYDIQHLSLTGDIAWQFNAQTKQLGPAFARFVWPGELFMWVFQRMPHLKTVTIRARNPYDIAEITRLAPNIHPSLDYDGEVESCRSDGLLWTHSGQPLNPQDAIGFTTEHGEVVYPHRWYSDPAYRLDPAREVEPDLYSVHLRRVPAGTIYTNRYEGIDFAETVEGFYDPNHPIVDIVTMRAPFTDQQVRFNRQHRLFLPCYFAEIGKSGDDGYWFLESCDRYC